MIVLNGNEENYKWPCNYVSAIVIKHIEAFDVELYVISLFFKQFSVSDLDFIYLIFLMFNNINFGIKKLNKTYALVAKKRSLI